MESAHTEPGISPFLKARRAALDPTTLGLSAGAGRRRVRGLRREEAALLAGISVDYYTRIEQGRSRNISDSVLNAIARGLRLTEAEHTYLRNVAEPPAAGQPHQAVRPEVRMLLDAMEGVPAYVYGRCLDVLAWNRLGGRIGFDFDALPPGEHNMARLVFLHPEAKRIYPDWELNAEYLVANIRSVAGRHQDDPALGGLIAELLERSATFRRFWESQVVRSECHGLKRMINPVAGELILHYESLMLPAEPDQVLVTYTAVPGSPSAAALRLLSCSGSGAAWTTARPETALVRAT
jgi:transcriptional regulator with XRE-family HTH domain